MTNNNCVAPRKKRNRASMISRRIMSPKINYAISQLSNLAILSMQMHPRRGSAMTYHGTSRADHINTSTHQHINTSHVNEKDHPMP